MTDSGLTLDALSEQLGHVATHVDRVDHERTATAATVEGLVSELAGLRLVTGGLADGQEKLARMIAEFIARATEPDDEEEEEKPDPDRVEWMTVSDPAVAVEALVRVRRWVREVWTPYAAGEELQPCWMWHPDVVADLLACRLAWIASTGPKARPLSPADWITRFLEPAAKRVTRSLAECHDGYGHLTRGKRYDATPGDGGARALARWWAETHDREPEHPAPGLRIKTAKGLKTA